MAAFKYYDGTNWVELLKSSDISAWAKATTKPSYSASEISGILPHSGNARSNLGDPTVYETGIIDSEFTNKTMAYTPSYVKIYRSSDGSSLTEATEYGDSHKKALLVGDASTDLSIPVNNYLVIELTANSYVYLNMLYIYNSTSGTNFQYRIDISYNKSSWTTWVNYGDRQSTWPGHTVIRHSTISFMQNGTQGTHYGAVRVWIKCIKVSDSYTTGHVYKLQWWGGYPSGRRTYFYVDENQNHSFPAGVSASSFTEAGTALSSKYLVLTGGTMTGMLTVKSPIFGYEYNVNNNNAAFILDKPGANCSGIGSHAETDTIYFGACGLTGAWVDTYKQKWKVNGTIIEDGTALADKYLGKTAKATDADKLDGQDSAYYLNYNNFTNTPSISNATITIKQSGRTDQTFTLNGSATTINLDNTTYSVATTSANGLMSSTDKTRLNNIWNIWSADGTDDTLVNKVEEVLTVFNNFPESSNLVELLAAKVPTSRTINSKALTGDITLTYSDVGAASSDHDHTLSIGNGPVSPTYSLDPGTSYNLTAGGKTISFRFYGDGNTCNTAGISKKASTKLYLIGSESFTYGSATDAGTTYVNDGVYIDSDNALYAGGEKVVVTSDSRLSNARTPTAHASSSTTYGVGTSSNYGHVKLGAANQNGATAADGVAAPNGHTHSQYVTSSGVTSVATSGTGLSGGTITTSGTITLDSSSAGNAAANKVVLRNAAGSIQSEKLAISSGTTTKATMQYNSTEDCIEFVFA